MARPNTGRGILIPAFKGDIKAVSPIPVSVSPSSAPNLTSFLHKATQNLAAGAGLGGVAAFAGANCLFQQNCDLAFR